MNDSPDLEVTQILERIRLGDTEAVDRLMPLVYDELRAQAGALFSRQRANHTLQPTALVHDAYLKLVGSGGGAIEDRKHFFRVAAQAMRQLLVDHARARGAEKRGGDQHRVQILEGAEPEHPGLNFDAIELNDALSELAQLDARQAQVVELRLLGGLTASEPAEALGVSERTVFVDWRVARFWLEERLRAD